MSQQLPRLPPSKVFPRSDLGGKQSTSTRERSGGVYAKNTRSFPTVEAVESLAVSDDGQRVVVVELVVELVRVGVGVPWLRRFVATGCVVLLAGVVCVAALRAAAKDQRGFLTRSGGG